MELDDHQMPLFEWHPLSEEFDRRLRAVSAWMERFWPKYKNNPREFAQQVFAYSEIYIIELLRDQLIVETRPDGFCDGKPCYRHDVYVPYLGDDVLWYLTPRGLLRLPEGEVFRRTLILVIKCEESLADQQVQLALARIDAVLQAQACEINAFHSTLAAHIDELLCVARRDGMHALPA